MIWNAFKSLLHLIYEGITNLPTLIWGFFSSAFTLVTSGISAIVEFLGGLIDAIIEAFKALFKLLFVPADDFLNDKISSIKEILAKKFNVDTYVELVKALKGYTSGKLDFNGYIDISIWDKKLPTIQSFVRGFFYPLIVLGDIKFLLWLIRGTSPLGTSSAKGGEA